jgi:hypothetical protein
MSVSTSTQLVPQAVWLPVQVNVQVPSEHKGVPASDVHRRLQAPQLFASDWTFTHTPAQSRQPAGHTQSPLVQTYDEVQTLLHAPQLLLSFSVSIHVLPPQSAVPGEHESPHRPWAQAWFAAQALPQLPQLVALVCRLSQTVPQSV